MLYRDIIRCTCYVVHMLRFGCTCFCQDTTYSRYDPINRMRTPLGVESSGASPRKAELDLAPTLVQALSSARGRELI